MQLNEDKHAVTVNDMISILKVIVDEGDGDMHLFALPSRNAYFHEHRQVNHIEPVYYHEDACDPKPEFKGYALIID